MAKLDFIAIGLMLAGPAIACGGCIGSGYYFDWVGRFQSEALQFGWGAAGVICLLLGFALSLAVFFAGVAKHTGDL